MKKIPPRQSVVTLAQDFVFSARHERDDVKLAAEYAERIEEAIRRAVANVKWSARQQVARAERLVNHCVEAQERAERALWQQSVASGEDQ
jgi:hypothetical protein